jgi:hypothetical protein
MEDAKKMGPRRVADSHYFDEEQDPDPQYSENKDPDPDPHQGDADPHSPSLVLSKKKIVLIRSKTELHSKNTGFGSDLGTIYFFGTIT